MATEVHLTTGDFRDLVQCLCLPSGEHVTVPLYLAEAMCQAMNERGGVVVNGVRRTNWRVEKDEPGYCLACNSEET